MRVSAWLYLTQQLLCSAALLLCIGLSAGQRRFSPWRLALLAALLAAGTMYAQGLAAPLRLLMLPVAALAPLAAWPDAPRPLRLRLILSGLLTPLTLLGLLRLTVTLHLPWAVGLTAGCGALLLLARMERRLPVSLPCTSVEVCVKPRRAVLTALVDTGNLLRDGLTGLPVIVISRRAASRLLHLPPEGTLLPGMRLLPVRTVAGVSLMTVLRPDSVRILQGGTWQRADALIGLSPGGSEGFQALVPSSLLTAQAPAPVSKALSQ